MVAEVHISARVASLRVKASQKYQIAPEKCHIGHIVLQAMLDRPNEVHQIDGATGASETNLSVAHRSMQLADAMRKSGLQVGDHVVIMGNNHLDLCIPYFASHYSGYPMCAIDPTMTLSSQEGRSSKGSSEVLTYAVLDLNTGNVSIYAVLIKERLCAVDCGVLSDIMLGSPIADLKSLFHYIEPKIVFCPKDKKDHMVESLKENNHHDVHIVFFDDSANNLQHFIENHKGTINFKPAVFDQSKTAWLMLTSGTTGLPKVAIIPYYTLLNAMTAWWSQFTEKWHISMAMATIQWMSSLLIFISAPILGNVRLQASVPVSPQLLVQLINQYRPNITAWTPHLLGQFLEAAGNFVDLSCFKYIAIGGSAIEKPLYQAFSAKCSAYLYLVYGMTELLVPAFDFDKSTPFGSVGRPYSFFQYRIVGDNGEDIVTPNATGELWIKGDSFFKGYLNNPEETEKILTPDEWVMTGDIFYRDEQDYFYFVERKRLLIKYSGCWISPLQLENVVKTHPDVTDACVVGIEDQKTMEIPVAAIVTRNGTKVNPQSIFDLVTKELPEIKQIHGGIFFVEKLPETPSGKVHRAKVKEIAIKATKVYPSGTRAGESNKPNSTHR